MNISLEYYLVQLRRIAEHREKGAEREIQRIYKELLKDLRQFLGVEYARLAEDDRLTYEILQGKGEYARFLEEVEQRLNELTPQASEEIQAAVETVYELAYQGMVDAVQKSKTPESLKQLLKGLVGVRPEIIKRAVENPISGLTLKDTLEKNRKEVIYNIKREIGVGLTQGDRMSTMAKRISKQVDKDYRKAMTITRTEVHRVREAGFLDSAVEIEKTFQQSDSGMRMVKIWRTLLDERVRPQRKAYKRKSGTKARKKHTAGLRSYLGGPNHMKMEGVTVGVEELFDLGGGVKTVAPGQSGVAGHDINCRCFLGYDLEIPQEEPVDKQLNMKGKSDIINSQEVMPMSLEITVDRFTPCLVERQTGKQRETQYLPASQEDLKHLKKQGWLFPWQGTELANSEIYKLVLEHDDTIQGLVAIENVPDNIAYYLRLAESAPHNKGDDKLFEGVGGHLFAIAVQKSKEAGYGGFIYFEAKNMTLVRHYQKKFGAQWIGIPHEYSMFIDERRAESLLKEYTLNRGE